MPGSELARRRVLALLIAVAALAACLALVLGGDGDSTKTGADSPPPPDASPRVLEVLATLDDAAKAEQLILAGFEGKTAEQAEDSLRGAALPGSLLVGPQNWPGAGPGETLVEELTKAGGGGGIEPLIATAQEGGTYRSLVDLPPVQRAIEVGDRGDPELARRWGEETAEALERTGILLNLAPIADIATLDSPTADRAFSDDPETVTVMAAAALRGCLDTGIACAPGHFPGEGGLTASTAEGPGSVSLDEGTLESRELPPFEAAFREGAPAVVVSHALYPAYSPVTPASLAPPIYELLRGRLAFEGVAITDDLQAGAIRAGMRVEEAAVDAIAAGADVVQISDPAAAGRAAAALTEALASGSLDAERVDEAVARVLALKAGLGLLG